MAGLADIKEGRPCPVCGSAFLYQNGWPWTNLSGCRDTYHEGGYGATQEPGYCGVRNKRWFDYEDTLKAHGWPVPEKKMGKDMNVDDIPVGDWVRVWGRRVVPDRTAGELGPEEIVVSMESKSTSFVVIVRRDHVEHEHGVAPEFAKQCTALFHDPDAPNDQIAKRVLVRCSLHDGHSGVHLLWGTYRREDNKIVGYFEERS